VPAAIILIIAQDYLESLYSLESLLCLLGDLRKRRLCYIYSEGNNVLWIQSRSLRTFKELYIFLILRWGMGGAAVEDNGKPFYAQKSNLQAGKARQTCQPCNYATLVRNTCPLESHILWALLNSGWQRCLWPDIEQPSHVTRMKIRKLLQLFKDDPPETCLTATHLG